MNPLDGSRRHAERAALIAYVERHGTFGERIWLPLLRLAHRVATRGDA